MLQVRPETAWSRINQPAEIVDQKAAAHAARLFVAGMTGSPGVVSGRVHVASSLAEAEKTLKPGDILVVAETTHSWERLLSRAGGVITEIGGPGSHSAVVMRELEAGVGRRGPSRPIAPDWAAGHPRRQPSHGLGWRAAGDGAVCACPSARAQPRSIRRDRRQDLGGGQTANPDVCRCRGSPLDRQAGISCFALHARDLQVGARGRRPAPGHSYRCADLRRHAHGVFSAVFRWREQACALSLEDLEALNQERLAALSVYLQASAALQPTPVAVRAWIDACVALNMMMGLSYTIYEAIEAMLAREAFENRIPPLILMQARLAQADRMGPSETAMALRDFDRLQARNRRRRPGPRSAARRRIVRLSRSPGRGRSRSGAPASRVLEPLQGGQGR